MRQRFRGLFGSHYTQIGNDAAMNCLGIVEVDDLLGEIGAITVQQSVGFAVRLRIQQAYEFIILFGTRGNAEAISRAVVGGPRKLIRGSAADASGIRGEETRLVSSRQRGEYLPDSLRHTSKGLAE